MNGKIMRQVSRLKAVRNDPYYSTVAITNALMRRPSLPMSPLNARLFYIASKIYKNETNGYKNYHLPDMNQFPDITDTKSYVTFKYDKNVDLIDVEATTGNLYDNVEEAVLSLVPDDLQESILNAKSEFKEQLNISLEAQAEYKSIEVWLEDDKNKTNPKRAQKQKELEVAKANAKKEEKLTDEKQDIYYKLIEEAATAIENNFDPSKVTLAKKIDKLLDIVDNNAVGALSMFTAGGAGLLRGLGVLDKEITAMTQAQALTTLIGKQKAFIAQRLERLGKGALLALPNIFIGGYYAGKQLSLVRQYKKIVGAVLDGAKALEEQQKEAKEKDGK
jgi:hypothetical protein